MTHWTPADVEARLSEAGMILRRLPEPRRNGYFSTWPEIVHGFADKVDQEPKPMRVSPSPRDIARMEETLTWTNCLEPIDGKIVWMKAHDERWKNICWHVGLCHAAAHQHWRYGLSLIALNLNRQPFNRKLPILEIIKLARSL